MLDQHDVGPCLYCGDPTTWAVVDAVVIDEDRRQLYTFHYAHRECSAAAERACRIGEHMEWETGRCA